MSKSNLPSNVRISTHPCIQVKLSQLRSSLANARDTKRLVHEIGNIIGCEALSRNLSVQDAPIATSGAGYQYTTKTLIPKRISIIPILRSGLGLVEAIQSLLPEPVPVHHLGLYREPATLEAVEYYNNLPYHQDQPASSTNESSSGSDHHLAILLDPIIATGGTCEAAIQTLKDWGLQKVLVIAVLGAAPGLMRAASVWPVGTEIWVAGLDENINEKGMIVPGLGDVGDRLFLTIGK